MRQAAGRSNARTTHTHTTHARASTQVSACRAGLGRQDPPLPCLSTALPPACAPACACLRRAGGRAGGRLLDLANPCCCRVLDRGAGEGQDHVHDARRRCLVFPVCVRARVHACVQEQGVRAVRHRQELTQAADEAYKKAKALESDRCLSHRPSKVGSRKEGGRNREELSKR